MILLRLIALLSLVGAYANLWTSINYWICTHKVIVSYIEMGAVAIVILVLLFECRRKWN
jgi:hypothetical protein